MKLLNSVNGSFLLHNAVKIDFYVSSSENLHSVFMAIDHYKNLLHNFESSHDAEIFRSIVETEVLDFILPVNEKSAKYEIELGQICDIALEYLMKNEDIDEKG